MKFKTRRLPDSKRYPKNEKDYVFVEVEGRVSKGGQFGIYKESKPFSNWCGVHIKSGAAFMISRNKKSVQESLKLCEKYFQMGTFTKGINSKSIRISAASFPSDLVSKLIAIRKKDLRYFDNF